MFLLTLISLRAVASDKVFAHISFARHINMAVGTATVITDPLQKVRAHRHLLFGYFMRERTSPICLLACTSEKPGADGHFVRVMDVGASVTMVALAKSVIVHTVLFGLLFLLFGLSNYS